MRKLDSTNSSLQRENLALNNNIELLKRTNEQLSDENNGLRDLVEKVETEKADEDLDIQNLQLENSKLKAEVARLIKYRSPSRERQKDVEVYDEIPTRDVDQRTTLHLSDQKEKPKVVDSYQEYLERTSYGRNTDQKKTNRVSFLDRILHDKPDTQSLQNKDRAAMIAYKVLNERLQRNTTEKDTRRNESDIKELLASRRDNHTPYQSFNYHDKYEEPRIESSLPSGDKYETPIKNKQVEREYERLDNSFNQIWENQGRNSFNNRRFTTSLNNTLDPIYANQSLFDFESNMKI